MGNICTLKHFHKWFHFSLVLPILENRNIQSYGYSIYGIKSDCENKLLRHNKQDRIISNDVSWKELFIIQKDVSTFI